MFHAQWIELNSGTSENLNEIFFPVDEVGYVVGNNGTVLKTIDAGANWSTLNTGLDLHFNELHFLSAEEGWIVGDSGSVCYTANGGSDWDCSFLESAENINLHSVFALNSETVFIGGQSFINNGYLSKSIDGGDSWQPAFVETYIWDVDLKKIGMINDSVGYAATRGTVLKTIDYGMNWFITDTASVHAGELFHVLEDMAFFPNSDTVYVCGWYGAYFGTTINGGTQWLHNNEYQNYNLDFLDSQTGYVGGWGAINKTTDGGESFVDASGGNSSLFQDIYSIDFVNEGTGYACGYGGLILKTSNGGGTVGIQALSDSKPLITFFPNPAKNLITFSNKTNVQLNSITGEIVAVVKNTSSLDISDQASGTYFLILTDDNGLVVQRNKIIIE